MCIRDSSYVLVAACRLLGAEPLYLGISEDRPESVERQFRAALDSDCIVSSSGVSVGDHDHGRPVLEKLGCELDFWGVKMKPGYPLAFGRFKGATPGGAGVGPLVFGLPGNPVSANVSYNLFVRTSLLEKKGVSNCFRPVIRARLKVGLEKKPGRMHFVRVSLENHGGTWEARSTGNQSSGALSSMTRADGLLVFPEDSTALSEGEEVLVQLLGDGPSGEAAMGF